MATFQFKRVLDCTDNFNDATEKIRNLKPKLKDGEPLLCSYNDNGLIKYLIAIGVADNIRIIPSFTDENDVISYIQKYSVNLNIKDYISYSDESDLNVELDDENKMIFKVKDELKNIWIDLDNE